MAIREELVLDTRAYMSSLKGADRAAVKAAEKQQKNWKNASRSMEQLTNDIKRLKIARDLANDPNKVRIYTQAIESLQREYNQLERETKEYAQAVRSAGVETDKTSSGMVAGFKKIGSAAKFWIAGAAIGALTSLAIVLRDVAREQVRFDKAMTESLAIQGKISLEQRVRMEEEAKRVAKSFNLATDEVAKGYFFLASAGLNVEQQIRNLEAVSQFAKAGTFDLATATDLLTDAQSALGLSTENVVQNQRNLIRVSDVLAKANTVSNATIQQFSEALTNKGATALKNYNKEIEEGVSVLAAYADQGIKGRLAGERFNILLKRLIESAQDNKKEFEELGVAVFDASGGVRNIADIVADLEHALAGTTDQQRASTLAMLGFTAETQDAILPLLGLSNQLRDYQEELKNAQGTTQEIADNQLQSLEERFKTVKRSIVDALGDDTVALLERFASLAEEVSDSIDRIAENRSDKDYIRELFGDENVGDYLRNRFDIKDFLDEQRKNTRAFIAEVNGIQENIEFFGGREAGSPELQEAYTRQLNKNAEALQRQKEGVENSVRAMQSLIQSGELNAIQSAQYTIILDEQKKRLDALNESIEQAQSLYQSSAGQTPTPTVQQGGLSGSGIFKVEDIEIADELLTILTEISNTQAPTQLDVWLSTAVGSVQQYNEGLTRLQNELSAGSISQQTFNEESAKLSDTFLTSLKQVYKTLKGQLNPAQEEFFKKLFANFKEATDETAKNLNGFADNLSNIADAASGLLSVADAFGEMDDNLQGVIRGTIDLLRNMENLQRVKSHGLLASLVPGIGIAGSVLSIGSSIINGLQSDDSNNDELRELERTIQDQIDATERNTKALLRDSVVGSDTRAEDIRIATDLINSLGSLGPRVGMGGVGDGTAFMSSITSEAQAQSIFAQLEDMFPEFFSGLFDDFGTMVDSNGLMNALQQIQERLRNVFSDFTENFGTYGESIEGAIQQFRDALQFGGVETQTAFESFIDALMQLGTDIPRDYLNQIRNIDLSSEDGIETLNNWIETLFGSRLDFMGDVSPDEYQSLLDFLQSLTDGTDFTTDDSSVTRNVAGVASITEFTANELMILTEAQLRELSTQTGNQDKQLNVLKSINESIFMMYEIADSQAMQGFKVESTNNFEQVFNFDRPLTQSDIREISDEVARILQSEYGGNGF